MIAIEEKSKCCGCSACVSICPKKCISFSEDHEGFIYPMVNAEDCIDCGLCEKVCPVLHQNEERLPLKTFAAYNKNESVRIQSSSGGVFTILAEEVIEQGGVVFGARFNDDWEVIHDFTETKEGLAAFRGSKYVQSNVGDSFSNVKSFLEFGRKVLFSGTPCQVAGLKKYLRKDYPNLLTVDFICHGVPSPMVWRKYLNEICDARQGVKKIQFRSLAKRLISGRDGLLDAAASKCIKSISFRDKTFGWKKYSFVLNFSEANAEEKNSVSNSTRSEYFYDNAYMQAFLSNLSLRPSCYDCPAKSGKSSSDLTLGDFWGIEKLLPQFDDDKGCGVAILYTNYTYFKIEHMNIDRVVYDEILKGNPCLATSVSSPLNRNLFFVKLKFGDTIHNTISYLNSTGFLYRCSRFIYRIILRLI